MLLKDPLRLAARLGVAVLRPMSQAIENSNISNAADASKFTRARRNEYRVVEPKSGETQLPIGA